MNEKNRISVEQKLKKRSGRNNKNEGITIVGEL